MEERMYPLSSPREKCPNTELFLVSSGYLWRTRMVLILKYGFSQHYSFTIFLILTWWLRYSLKKRGNMNGCWFRNRGLRHLLHTCIGGWRKFFETFPLFIDLQNISDPAQMHAHLSEFIFKRSTRQRTSWNVFATKSRFWV